MLDTIIMVKSLRTGRDEYCCSSLAVLAGKKKMGAVCTVVVRAIYDWDEQQ